MPAKTDRRWSLDEVRDLTARQPGKWPLNELIGGALLVTPAPSLGHARVAFALEQMVVPYVHRHRLGEWLQAPADITLQPGTLVQPDRFLVPSEIARRARTWSDITHLGLVVEVTSPATARYDRGLKREHYQHAGVGEYWIVDLSSELVERWRPHDQRPEVLRDRLEWRPSGATEPLVIDLRTLFAAAHPAPR